MGFVFEIFLVGERVVLNKLEWIDKKIDEV